MMANTLDPTSPLIRRQKAALRRTALLQREVFATDHAQAFSAAQAVAERVMLESTQPHSPLNRLFTAGIVAGYWPLSHELDPRPLMALLASQGITLALPAITPEGLVFRHWQVGEALVAASFGTWEPPQDAPLINPAVLLMPLVAFDQNRNRLGYGKGYYDSAIAKLSATQ